MFSKFVFGTVALIFLLLASPCTADLLAHYGPSEVTVSGFKEGTSIAWMVAERRPVEWAMSLFTDRGVVKDDDGDGKLSISWDRESPPQGIFVAVDLETGEIAWAGPAEYSFTATGVDPAWFSLGTEGASSVSGDWPTIHGLWVRPGAQDGSGVWWLGGTDGGDTDDDQQSNGVIVLPFGQADPADGVTPVPTEMIAGDTLVMLDPTFMRLAVWSGGSGPEEGLNEVGGAR